MEIKLKKAFVVFSFLISVLAAKAQTTPNFTINKTSGCVPLSGVNFTDASTGGTITNRVWNLGNGTNINNGPAVVGTN